MYEQKPVLAQYQLKWHYLLKPAEKASLAINKHMGNKREDMVYIWPREYTLGSKRDFVVETRHKFWEKYKRMRPIEQIYYELIRTNDPCRFFMDLEFCKELNPDIDVEKTMNALRNEIKEIFLIKFGIVLEL